MITYENFLRDNYKENEKICAMEIASGKLLSSSIMVVWDLMKSVPGRGIDCYMSMNPLVARDRKVKRDKAHVGRLKWLYTDLDYYNSCYKDYTKQQVMGLLELDHFGQTVPEPTYVIDSGRGIYLLWKIDEHINAYPRWEKMQRYLYEQLQEFGADRKVVSDSARVLRMVGSINTKSGTAVEVVKANHNKYSLTNLIRDYIIKDIPTEKMLGYAKHISELLGIQPPGNSHSEVKEFIRLHKDRAQKKGEGAATYKKNKKNRNNICQKDQGSLLEGRIRDLEHLLLKHRDREGGCREHILFLYRYWQLCATNRLEDGLAMTLRLNGQLRNPLDEREVINATASAEKYFNNGRSFRCRNSYVIEALGITQEEMEGLSVFIDQKERSKRKKERNRKAYSKMLQRYGKATKESQIRTRRQRIQKLLQKGRSQQEICREMNISRATFYADKRQIELYLAMQKNRKEKMLEMFQAYCKFMEEKSLKISALLLYMSFRTCLCPLVGRWPLFFVFGSIGAPCYCPYSTLYCYYDFMGEGLAMPRKRKPDELDENQIEMIVVERADGAGPAELVISPRVPSRAVKTKDNVSNFITNILDAGEQLLEMDRRGRVKQQIRTKVTFSYEGIDIKTRKEFTLFDQEVHDAVVSLYLAENHFISPAMVYRAMTGKTNSEYIHSAKLREIEESIDKCMFSKLSIDASEEALMYGYEESVYSGSLLAMEKVTVKMGGHSVIAYRVLVEPLLYRYAKSYKQVTSVDIKLLDTPVAKTNDTIVLQGFLLRKIEAMKSDRFCKRTILYSDIYNVLNLPKEKRVQLTRIREYTKEILDFWKEKRYICNYEVIMQGRSFKEITIFLS